MKDLAVLGKEVEVSLGYVSSFQKVFKGFLASVEMTLDAEDGITVEFTALDVRWLNDDGQFPLPGAYGKKLFRRSPGDHEAVQKAVQRKNRCHQRKF